MIIQLPSAMESSPIELDLTCSDHLPHMSGPHKSLDIIGKHRETVEVLIVRDANVYEAEDEVQFSNLRALAFRECAYMYRLGVLPFDIQPPRNTLSRVSRLRRPSRKIIRKRCGNGAWENVTHLCGKPPSAALVRIQTLH